MTKHHSFIVKHLAADWHRLFFVTLIVCNRMGINYVVFKRRFGSTDEFGTVRLHINGCCLLVLKYNNVLHLLWLCLYEIVKTTGLSKHRWCYAIFVGGSWLPMYYFFQRCWSCRGLLSLWTLSEPSEWWGLFPLCSVRWQKVTSVLSSPLLLCQGFAILKLGKMVQRSSRQSTSISVCWPNFSIWTVPQIVRVLAMWLFFLACLVW